MKTLTAHILTDESLTAVIDGEVFTMSNAHPSFSEAQVALADGDIDGLFDLFNVAQTIVNKMDAVVSGALKIVGGTLSYKGSPIHNYVTDKIFEFMQGGYPFQPLVNFLEKLLANPSRRAIEELYKFLEHKHLPICEDGDFLAYKGVGHDYRDLYSGKFFNHVGAVLEMPRNAVCDDADVGCSYGFHAGSYEYAKDYAGGRGKLVIVKINPADVVSVPKDCDCQKLRTSRYEVVKDFDGAYTKPLTTETFKRASGFHNVRDSKGRFARKS